METYAAFALSLNYSNYQNSLNLDKANCTFGSLLNVIENQEMHSAQLHIKLSIVCLRYYFYNHNYLTTCTNVKKNVKQDIMLIFPVLIGIIGL